MITYPTVVLKCGPYQYAKVLNLCGRTLSSITGNSSFTSPTPALVVVQAAMTALQDAYATWGEKGNRGSHADWVALRTASFNAYQLLRALGEYVQNTAELEAGSSYIEMAAIIVSSGFEMKATPAPQGLPLDAVRNLRKVNSYGLNANQVDLRWVRPLNVTSRGNVKGYIVYKSATGNFDDATAIANVSKGRFVDTNNSTSSVTWSYWICPVSAAGNGQLSAKITVTVLGTSSF